MVGKTIRTASEIAIFKSKRILVSSQKYNFIFTESSNENETYFELIEENEKYITKFKARVMEKTFKLNENEGHSPEEFMRKALDALLEEFVNNDLNARDKGGLTISNSTSDKPIYISYRSPEQMSSDVILNEFSRVIQSNEKLV